VNAARSSREDPTAGAEKESDSATRSDNGGGDSLLQHPATASISSGFVILWGL